MQKIAFIGLGNMGGPMAHRLLKAGYTVRAFDMNPEALARLVAAGAEEATSAADAVKGAEVVISMLPEDRHVKGLYMEDSALLEAVSPNTILIDCSTISPHTSRQVADFASSKGLAMLDAPVSGGTAGAENGTLAFMIGGDAGTFDQCRALFEVMGKSIFHVGESGAGQSVKICNNMLAAVLMAGTAEALAFGVKSGIDPVVLSDVITKSSGQNFMVSKWNPWPGVDPATPSSNGFNGGFQLRLMLKDLNLATASAAEFQSSVPVASVTKSLLALHMQQTPDDAAMDFSSVIKLFNSNF